MKILVLMPLQEQSAYMAMGIYKNLPAAVKDKTFCMPAFMDYLVTTKLVPNWEYALFDTILCAEKMAAVEDEDLILLGNVNKNLHFDAIFNFQDINEALPYSDPFVETMKNKVRSEELLLSKVDNLYTAEDSTFRMKNCRATADFLTAYLDTDPKLKEIKAEYEKQLQELKNGDKQGK